MSDTEPANNTRAASPTKPSREITDPKAMRALAHPVRLAILDAMRNEGELTATRAAELLNQSPGNMSWHLQTLAKYGFIVEAEGVKGRSRPWKISPVRNEFNATESVPGSVDAIEHLAITVLERGVEQLQQWWRQHKDFGEGWFDASFVKDDTSFLTSAELAEISEQMERLMSRYNERSDPAQRPAEALPVHIVTFAHPMPRTESGERASGSDGHAS
jgi:DNA-binding transcriptional ArsR family regulator